MYLVNYNFLRIRFTYNTVQRVAPTKSVIALKDYNAFCKHIGTDNETGVIGSNGNHFVHLPLRVSNYTSALCYMLTSNFYVHFKTCFFRETSQLLRFVNF